MNNKFSPLYSYDLESNVCIVKNKQMIHNYINLLTFYQNQCPRAEYFLKEGGLLYAKYALLVWRKHLYLKKKCILSLF